VKKVVGHMIKHLLTDLCQKHLSWSLIENMGSNMLQLKVNCAVSLICAGICTESSTDASGMLQAVESLDPVFGVQSRAAAIPQAQDAEVIDVCCTPQKLETSDCLTQSQESRFLFLWLCWILLYCNSRNGMSLLKNWDKTRTTEEYACQI
jgi:hypothetical protein